MTEAEEHANFIAHLKKKGLSYDHHATHKRPTNTKGHPDFEIYEDGRVLFIEMKTPIGIVSKDQTKRIAELRSKGMTVRIAFSSTEAISYLEHWRLMAPRGPSKRSTRPLDVGGYVLTNMAKGKTDA